MKKVVIKTLEIIGTMLILLGLSVDDRTSVSPDIAFKVTLILIAAGGGCIWLASKIQIWRKNFMTPNPCRNCTTHAAECHTTCEKYIAWRREYHAEKDAEYNRREGGRYIPHYKKLYPYKPHIR